jgi:hypothetical protein
VLELASLFICDSGVTELQYTLCTGKGAGEGGAMGGGGGSREDVHCTVLQMHKKG